MAYGTLFPGVNCLENTYVTSAQELAGQLRDYAITATELGAANRLDMQLRIESAGLLVYAASWDGEHTAARMVPWSDVIALKGAVITAIGEVVETIQQKMQAAGTSS
jgi:hypothetical protein